MMLRALPGLLLLLAARPATGTANSSWTLATEHMALTFDSDGVVASVVDKATGRDYALRGAGDGASGSVTPERSIISAVFTNASGLPASSPSSVRFDQATQTLTATFSNGAVVPVSVNTTGEMIVFTLLGEAGTAGALSHVLFLTTPLRIDSCAAGPTAAFDKDFAVVLLPGSWRTEVRAVWSEAWGEPMAGAWNSGRAPHWDEAYSSCDVSANGVILRAHSTSVALSAHGSDKPHAGHSAALWGGPRAQLDKAIQRGEAEFGLPSPSIDGTWAKRANDAQKGYFLISVTPDTLNQTIDYAAQSGMKYITFLDNIWSGDGGHYNYVSAATIACHLLPTQR